MIKKFEEICEPDPRRLRQVVLDENGQMKSLTLEHIHSNLHNIKLHVGVPENIQTHFEIAQTLYLFSWFYYPFDVVSQQYAFITVEFALKERYGIHKTPIVIADGAEAIKNQLYNEIRKNPFKKLFRQAVTERHITDKGFSLIQFDRLLAIAESKSDKFKRNKPNPYSHALIEILPDFRNQSAHGSIRLNAQGSEFLIICVELINQLFDTP